MGILAILALPLLLVGISGIIYIYQSVRWLLSKSAVQNKVVVITDATSGLGKGELSLFFSVSEKFQKSHPLGDKMCIYYVVYIHNCLDKVEFKKYIFKKML